MSFVLGGSAFPRRDDASIEHHALPITLNIYLLLPEQRNNDDTTPNLESPVLVARLLRQGGLVLAALRVRSMKKQIGKKNTTKTAPPYTYYTKFTEARRPRLPRDGVR